MGKYDTFICYGRTCIPKLGFSIAVFFVNTYNIARTCQRNSVRTDPQEYHPVDTIVTHLQRQFPMDRITPDDVISATQASPTSFLVMFKNGNVVIRSINPSDTRAVAGARLMSAIGPKPGTPPNDVGRNMLGSLAEVVRGLMID